MATQQVSIDNSYEPFNLANVQGYNPIFNRFFDMGEDNYNMIALNHRYQIADLHTLHDQEGKKVKQDVFVKFSPLLDPLKFITGKYNLKDPKTIALPSLDPASCSSKIGNANNCSYTDAFFSYLSNMLLEKHGFVHGVSFYGSALAVQNRFRFNLADDLDFVKDSDFFMNNIGKYVTLDETAEVLVRDFSGSGSRSNRQKIAIDVGETCDIEIDATELTIDVEEVPVQDAHKETDALLEYEKPALDVDAKHDIDDDSSDDSSSGDSSSGDSSKSESESESGDDSSDSSQSDKTEESEVEDSDKQSNQDSKSGSDWETESETESDDTEFEKEEPVYCYLHDFPVQMIFQERCQGTLDELLMRNELESEQLIAALFQIVMILLTYQKAFDFTHNDLHTNNIMYVATDEMYINYCFENTWYRVPTHGRIYKLIDFGRAIYRFQDKIFCSDSFAPGGDAYSQYNCEPFFNESKPRLDPNFSFDLCRLGCSFYDFIAEDEDDKSNVVDTLIKKWCSDDDDKNVVYKKNGQERYPNFKLYKMIARTVHGHSPKSQLTSDTFKSFVHSGKSESFAKCDGIQINIDEIPKYKLKL